MYAIVDIETTGSYAAANGITEIAIYVFNGKKVTRKFETLINPCQPIPGYIQSFTGITDEMVAGAPLFEDVSEEIFEILRENIFIAHNVNFDYSFIKSHLLRAGFDLNSKKLCTVRLSRRIFPGFASYSLGNLCRSLGIRISNRHRAGGDAAATVQVFKKLLKADTENFIDKSLQRNSKEQLLPPNVPKADFDKLPYTPGVYYFHNQKGKIIYIGKAKNIRSRVNSHFSNNSESRQKQNFILNVHSISFQTCATELMAEILESAEIKKYWPLFNQSQKNREEEFAIYSYPDQNGYLRLGIDRKKKVLKPVITFRYLTEGHGYLRKMISEYHLCPKLCFLQTDDTDCIGLKDKTCKGACKKKERKSTYNKRVDKAIAWISKQSSFVIIDQGMTEEEKSCILVEEGRFYGMGYVPAYENSIDIGIIKDYLSVYKENSYIRNLVHEFRLKYPGQIIELESSK